MTSSDHGPGWYVEVRRASGGTLEKRFGPYRSRSSAELAEIAASRSVALTGQYTVVRERQ